MMRDPVSLGKRRFLSKKGGGRLENNDTDTAANVLSSLGSDGKKKRISSEGNEEGLGEGHEEDELETDVLDAGFDSERGNGSSNGRGGNHHHHQHSSSSQSSQRQSSSSSTTKAKFCFNEADDRKILEAYHAYGCNDHDSLQSETGIMKKWQFVADYLNNGATAHQVGRRWREKLDPQLANLRSGTFNQEEDEKLIRLIEEHMSDGRGGGKNWTAIAAKMNRKPKECEHRGATLMSKHQKQGSFTHEEDELLLRLHAEGKNFNEIGRILNRKPKRCQDRLETASEILKSVAVIST